MIVSSDNVNESDIDHKGDIKDNCMEVFNCLILLSFPLLLLPFLPSSSHFFLLLSSPFILLLFSHLFFSLYPLLLIFPLLLSSHHPSFSSLHSLVSSSFSLLLTLFSFFLLSPLPSSPSPLLLTLSTNSPPHIISSSNFYIAFSPFLLLHILPPPHYINFIVWMRMSFRELCDKVP